MIVLDTTVLHYAQVDQHEFREDARRLISLIEAGRVQATTTAEVLQEFVHVYARRRSRADAARLARQYAELLSPLLPTDRSHLDAGLRLFVRYPQLGAFDAVLAAIAIAHGATLVSADSDFEVVPSLRLAAPGTSPYAKLVATDERAIDER